MNRVLLIKLSLLTGILVLAALWFDNSYEYKSILDLPSQKSNLVTLEDTLVIDPVFYIESTTQFNVNLVVKHLSDSIRFTSLDVTISSGDCSGQKIILTHVLAYTDTVFDEDINRSYVPAGTFTELPLHYKSMSRGRDFNCLRFFFETENVDESKTYTLSICGTAVFRGRVINFRKSIHAVRRKKFRPIQMMT